EKEKVSFDEKMIQVGKVRLKVEIADTDARRSRGLMNRQKMAENHGMLFIFDYKRTLSFWMKNTYIPLSIGFFDEEKRLMEILDMDPVASVMDQKTPFYRSKSPAQYALEVNKGWFQRNGVEVGSTWSWVTKPTEKSGTDQGRAEKSR
ncbi:MAG: DUF192 domain-containing protein, partial [Bdellovibrionales bacterium]|nr:DUF192 domain-containing protein [Bdellovibrionales bacterium]